LDGYSIKLNDKANFMSSKKFIMIFDSWLGFQRRAEETIRLTGNPLYILTINYRPAGKVAADDGAG